MDWIIRVVIALFVVLILIPPLAFVYLKLTHKGVERDDWHNFS